jgi:hypothetical protein
MSASLWSLWFNSDSTNEADRVRTGAKSVSSCVGGHKGVTVRPRAAIVRGGEGMAEAGRVRPAGLLRRGENRGRALELRSAGTLRDSSNARQPPLPLLPLWDRAVGSAEVERSRVGSGTMIARWNEVNLTPLSTSSLST